MTVNKTKNTDIATNLLPCPFCGDAPCIDSYLASRLEAEYNGARDTFFVECETCDFHLPAKLSLELAMTAWNTRTQYKGGEEND